MIDMPAPEFHACMWPALIGLAPMLAGLPLKGRVSRGLCGGGLALFFVSVILHQLGV